MVAQKLRVVEQSGRHLQVEAEARQHLFVGDQQLYETEQTETIP